MNLEELVRGMRNDAKMDQIYAKIKEYANYGWSYCPFGSGDATREDEITEFQVEILRKDGYRVEWNRALLSYEVRGWKQ